MLAVSVTDRGRALAATLPWERAHGRLAERVRSRWPDVDALVLFVAVGAAVRVVAPLLGDKGSDPAVVCVDEAGRFAVALCGGHAGGANDLARQVAELVGAQPVLTTATDSAGLAALDMLPGYTAEGDVAAVTAAILDGRQPVVAVDADVWPAPPGLAIGGRGPEVVLVTDRAVPSARGLVALRPPSLVAGIGTSTGASAAEVEALLDDALVDAGLSRSSVAEVATLDRRAADRAIGALGLPVRAWSAASLAAVPVPSASAVVEAAVGTPSVSEAAALTAAGPGAELVAPKRASAHATVALARRRRPPGRVRVVGLGPGHARHRTPAAESAVRSADVVIGYGPYVDACSALLSPHQEVVRSPVGEEVVRAKQAVAEADAGRQVALVSSGDAGVYGMASLVLEVAGDAAGGVEVEVVPGVTAALAGAALLGAPLGHDHAVVSLSDLLTPWEVIEARLRAAAQADLVLALYNPRSRRRTWQLDSAREVLLAHRPPTTPVGLVTDAARPG
ncbi:MAG: precorrin-3B C(17)-methyltransferase, partial [Actinobacteria bacterium]|nr:precorrin-3B C(17)-methyltransferase [Actinomycetota bacterium]